MSLGLQSFGSSALSRWLSGWVWRVEHAFERAAPPARPRTTPASASSSSWRCSPPGS
jgi:hypothetical protein